MSKKSARLFCALALSFATVAYAQTDATLTASVKTKLAADEMVKASAVNVSTNDHVVTLSGAVASKAAKEGRRPAVESIAYGIRHAASE